MASSRSKKGISPLVATVLLIAFVVAIAGVVAAWLGTFTKDQTQLVSDQSKLQINCQAGKVAMKNLRFASASSSLSGTMENNGFGIALGNLTLTVIYQNATSEAIQLCSSSTGAASCSSGNMTLLPAQLTTFNVTIGGSNYDIIKLSTNCTTAYHTAQRGDIS